MTGRAKVLRDIRIGACADYLLGVRIKLIVHRWGVTETSLKAWLRRTDHFKLRNRKLK